MPVESSQMRISPTDPTITSFPSGAQATQETSPSWFENVRKHSPVRMFHTGAPVLSVPTANLPSGLTARSFTPP
nr:hypothetical protein [Candidatus Freyarchaeota archaeon]